MRKERATMAIMRERCQFENSVYDYVPPFGALRRLKRIVRRLPDRFATRVGEGRPSRYAAGEWVRVKAADVVRSTLDMHGALRGLRFTNEQWAYCGRTFAVETVVRRIMNDAGRMLPVGRTVALRGVTCDGPEKDAGCGRACSLLFRDDWLEPSAGEHAAHLQLGPRVRVKSAAAIAATLDRAGRRDGVLFAAAMERYAGTRLAVHKNVQPLAARWWRRARGDWFILDGARCTGEMLGADGPCHRGCSLLWHRDWLEFDADA